MSLLRNRFFRKAFHWLTLLGAVLLSLPPARSLIEQSMFWHMIVQMPLLVVAGYGLTARKLLIRFDQLNRFGLTSFMAALVILTYWMLPISIDRAITMPSVDVAKVVSLLLCGFCLKTSIDKAPGTVQLFFIGYLLAMLVTLGVYFVNTDIRLCNAYSQESQIWTGYGLIALAVICAALLLLSPN